MNDTVGVAIQEAIPVKDASLVELEADQSADSVDSENNPEDEAENRVNTKTISNKRRRSFTDIVLDIPQYSKKPKLTETILCLTVCMRVVLCQMIF